MIILLARQIISWRVYRGKANKHMDDSFYYDENGVLQGVPHPNPDYLYPNLFYQGITRVREKIALVIVNSPRLFEKISSIFDIEQEA